jgi:hypothetical protein
MVLMVVFSPERLDRRSPPAFRRAAAAPEGSLADGSIGPAPTAADEKIHSSREKPA